MQCRSLASQLGRLYKELQAKDCEVLLILGEPVELARHYSEILKLPFPVLADPDRRVYHEYGLEKVMLMQRTASFVLDRQGIIRYVHIAWNPLTWLKESPELVAAVSALTEAHSI